MAQLADVRQAVAKVVTLGRTCGSAGADAGGGDSGAVEEECAAGIVRDVVEGMEGRLRGRSNCFAIS